MDRRPRTSHACDRCRSLRVKCSGDPCCDKCDRENAVCIYGDRKREKNKKDLAESQDRIQLLEYKIKDLKRVLRKVVSGSTLHEELQSEVDGVLSEFVDVDNDVPEHTPNTSSSIRDDTALAQHLKGVQNQHIWKNGENTSYLDIEQVPNFGRSIQSTNQVAPTITGPLRLSHDSRLRMLDDKDMVTAKYPPSAWTDVTTNDFLVQHLLTLYFCWEYPCFASFSKEHFLLDYNSGSKRFCSSLLVNAILALGAKFSDLGEARTDPDDPNTAGDQFFNEAQRLLHTYPVPTVTTIQALNLMSLKQASSGQDESSWHYARQAMRIAIDLDLPNDDPNQEPLDSLGLGRAERQVRVATFWGCFTLEHAWAILIGRVPQLKLQDINIHKPIIIDEIESERWIAYTDEGSRPNEFTRQESNLRLVFIAFSDLSELVHESVMLLYSHEKPLNGHELLVIYTKYLQWYDNLPDQLRLGKNSTPVVMFVHLYFHWALLIHFRPFVRLKITTSSISPRLICVEASKSISALVRAYKSLYGLRRVPVFTPYMLMTAELCMIVETTGWAGEENDCPYPGENLEYLTELTTSCSFAQRAITICDWFRDRLGSKTGGTDREVIEGRKSPGASEGEQLAWDRLGTFFRPDTRLGPGQRGRPDPAQQQSLLPIDMGICLFPQQRDPLNKILQRRLLGQDEQDDVGLLREKLRSCGLEMVGT